MVVSSDSAEEAREVAAGSVRRPRVLIMPCVSLRRFVCITQNRGTACRLHERGGGQGYAFHFLVSPSPWVTEKEQRTLHVNAILHRF